jgi:hypothetical protein
MYTIIQRFDIPRWIKDRARRVKGGRLLGGPKVQLA